MASQGISGVAVTVAAAGGFLVYAGIRNVPILDGLRDLAAGRLPAPRPPAPTKVTFGDRAATGGGTGGTGSGSPQPGGQTGFGGRYSLGAVKSHVEAAAYDIGPRFGIKTIYGWAPGQYDHPKGLALDFMINNIANGKSVGDQLAAYVLANASRLRVSYVIWYRRSWNPGRGTWVPYSGASDHTDHVHVSFKA